LRADPTAAVAPERIRGGQPLRPPPGPLAGALGQVNPALWLQMRHAWETINNRWQQAVLGYSRSDQFDLLKRLGWSAPDWSALGQLSAGLIALIAAAGGLWASWQARPHDAWSRQRQWLMARLARLGIAAQAHQGLRQWAELLMARHGSAAAPLAELLLELERSRYAAAPAPALGLLARWRWQREFTRAAAPLRSRHLTRK